MSENRRRVLVVDDDELVCLMLQASLQAQFEVQGVSDGQTALLKASSEPWDLVILDVEMPGMDGYETCRQLRNTPATAELPVIFHSARTHIDERLQGYAAGGDDYLVKPFDPGELQIKIERVLSQRSRQSEMAGQLDEMMNAVLSSADMVGEAGVVLDFQRQLGRCQQLDEVAQALTEALGRFGLDGCVRLNLRQHSCSVNLRGPCSALELSILDHLQLPHDGPRIRPFGPHTGFGYGTVLVFVRGLVMNRPDSMDRQVAERMGRHIDNVALLVEGAMARLVALEAQLAQQELAGSRQLMGLTQEALTDISARNHAQRMQVQAVFERMREKVEHSFISLGLTSSQEDLLSDVIREHMELAMAVLSAGQDVDAHLHQVIQRLSQNGMAAH